MLTVYILDVMGWKWHFISAVFFLKTCDPRLKMRGKKKNKPEISTKRHVTQYITSTLENFKSHPKQVIHKKLSKLRGAYGGITNKGTLIL